MHKIGKFHNKYYPNVFSVVVNRMLHRVNYNMSMLFIIFKYARVVESRYNQRFG